MEDELLSESPFGVAFEFGKGSESSIMIMCEISVPVLCNGR